MYIPTLYKSVYLSIYLHTVTRNISVSLKLEYQVCKWSKSDYDKGGERHKIDTPFLWTGCYPVGWRSDFSKGAQGGGVSPYSCRTLLLSNL